MFINPTKYTLQDLESKVQRAAKVIEVVPRLLAATSFKNAEELIWRFLEKLGVYKDDSSHELLMSEHCVEGAARAVFCEDDDAAVRIPVPRFKMLWSILREGGASEKQVEQPDESTIGASMKELAASLKPIGQRPDKELLEQYGVDCETAVVDELRARSRGHLCIVFSDEAKGIVDVERSLNLLRHARRNEATPRTVSCGPNGSGLCRVYPIGEFPQLENSVCPIHGHVMLIDGYCDECKIDWSQLSGVMRQFFKVAHDCRELPMSRIELRKLIVLAEEAVNIDSPEIASLLPETTMRFKELKRDNELPSLRWRKSSRPQDPLNMHRSY